MLPSRCFEPKARTMTGYLYALLVEIRHREHAAWSNILVTINLGVTNICLMIYYNIVINSLASRVYSWRKLN